VPFPICEIRGHPWAIFGEGIGRRFTQISADFETYLLKSMEICIPMPVAGIKNDDVIVFGG